NSLVDGPVNLSDGTLTLRDALFAANSGDAIDFEPSLFAAGAGTITLDQNPGQGQLNIAIGLTVTGPGADLLTIDANNGSRIFNIDDRNDATSSDVEIVGITLKGGQADSGGAIMNSESLTMTDCIVSGNRGSDTGGGLFNDGAAMLTGCTFSDNSAGTF